jgi:hypothetical protein
MSIKIDCSTTCSKEIGTEENQIGNSFWANHSLSCSVKLKKQRFSWISSWTVPILLNT